MILNRLGFSNRRLYLVAQFFATKPVEHLLGPGVTAEMLHDDCPGRTLDWQRPERGQTEIGAHAQGQSLVADRADRGCAGGGPHQRHLSGRAVSAVGRPTRSQPRSDGGGP